MESGQGKKGCREEGKAKPYVTPCEELSEFRDKVK